MSSSRFVYVDYCDDVRRELGSKLTLVGCYGSDLLLDSKQGAQVVLPKLCAVVRCITNIDQPFLSLKFRAYLGEELLGEMDLGPTPSTDAIGATSESKQMIASAVMAFVPLAINEIPTKLRIEVETECEVLRGQGLRIRLNGSQAARQEPSTLATLSH